MSLFSENTINIGITAKGKAEVIDIIIDMLFNDGVLNDKDKYKKAILKREDESTTGIGFGIAIPHAKTDAVNTPRVAVAVSPDGVDFESADGTLAKLIFMIAVPDNADDMHLKILAKLSRKLVNPAFRMQLIDADNKQIILDCLNQI